MQAIREEQGMTNGGEPPTTLRPEARLVLACARTHLDNEQKAAIAALAARGLDWNAAIDLAEAHSVMPLLYTSLRLAAADSVPADAMGRLQSLFYSNSLRNFALRDELIRTLRELQSRGVQAVPYKGPVLAENVYGDLSLRKFGDLDILARREQIPEAAQALRALGYALEGSRPVPDSAHYQMTHHHVFHRAEGDVYVELHWDIADPFFAVPALVEGFWGRVTAARLGGIEVPGIPSEDLMLFLCIHHTAEEWGRLAQICDIAEIVRAAPAMDWDFLRGEARRLGVSRMLRLGLRLARALLQAKLPDAVLAEVESDPVAARLASEAQRRLFNPSARPVRSADLARISRFRLDARERLRDKARYSIAAAFLPSLDDWEWVSLPKRFYGLYFLLRPVRMLAKYLRREERAGDK
jgi:hypothetical protein